MRLIELVGPPAVGKSSIVAAALGRGLRDARCSVLAPRNALVAPLLPRLRRVAGRRSPLDRIVRRLLVDPDEAHVEAALTAVGTDWAAFLALVLDGPVDGHADGPGGDRPPAALAVMERSWLLRAVQLRALLELERRGPHHAGSHRRAADTRLVPMFVLDEGLTHPYKAIAAVGASDAAIGRYADLVPLPDLLVVVDDDAEVLARRMRARYATTPERARWQALSADTGPPVEEIRRTQRIVRIVAERAAARGGEVIRLDAAGASPVELARELAHRSGVSR